MSNGFEPALFTARELVGLITALLTRGVNDHGAVVGRSCAHASLMGGKGGGQEAGPPNIEYIVQLKVCGRFSQSNRNTTNIVRADATAR